MSEFRNCLNCGAPIDASVNKCPYCGTSYIDICGIKTDGKTPFVLKFLVETGNKKYIYSALVITDGMRVSYDYDTSTSFLSSSKSCSYSVPASANISLDMFTLPQKMNNQQVLLTIEEVK